MVLLFNIKLVFLIIEQLYYLISICTICCTDSVLNVVFNALVFLLKTRCQ